MPGVAAGHIWSAPALLGTPLLSRLLSKVLRGHIRHPGNHPYPPAQHALTEQGAAKRRMRTSHESTERLRVIETIFLFEMKQYEQTKYRVVSISTDKNIGIASR